MKREIGKYTFRLFMRPSFLRGFVAVVDFSNLMNKYNTDDTEKKADFNSISSDWQAVGSDIRSAISQHESTR